MSGGFQSTSGQAQEQFQQQEQGTQQQQQQQQTQQTNSETSPTLRDHVALIALAIVALGRQLEGTAELESDDARKDAVRTASAEIIKNAISIADVDKLYITVPPGWEPPSMLEPCPSCSHLRSKGKRP